MTNMGEQMWEQILLDEPILSRTFLINFQIGVSGFLQFLNPVYFGIQQGIWISEKLAQTVLWLGQI